MTQPTDTSAKRYSLTERGLTLLMCLLIAFPFNYFSAACAQSPNPTPEEEKRQPNPETPKAADEEVYVDGQIAVPVIPAADLYAEANDTIPPTIVVADDYAYDENGKIPFDPSPTRAVWFSALCPGLGQIYNRRYWKLPIVIGGFMGLGYATNWYNNLYADYMQGYRDLLDDDPQTKSYMDFFPPTVSESSLDQSWLQRVFKSRKDTARRYRDLCIIGLAGLYALCMLDAYVDASLTHFDVSPDVSLDWAPTLMSQPGANGKPAIGLNWAFTF